MNTPTLCQHVWHLPGERREVQCRLPHDHGGMFHQSGCFITVRAS